ncbi:NB-ARC domain-containing protein [Saccharopolyspora shandongensis]|uniref:NB-ARC domain-containing protein n=2 Tax=Saccharopolyspora shandongensis TaxID=418495 RepID=A0A1H3CFP2_9PSEU|nr:NB-ARC domain-containing protein [Saccharopolyspora shandongensis]
MVFDLSRSVPGSSGSSDTRLASPASRLSQASVAYRQVIVTVRRHWGGCMGNENSGPVRNLVQAGAIHGGVHFHEQQAPEAPGQLLPEPVNFVDREPEREALDALLAEARGARAGCAVISGIRGVGKSALGTYWSHRVIDSFEHGQVRFDFGLGQRSLGEAAEHCLRSLGVAGDRIPLSDDDKIALLRTKTKGRKLLFFFDNVGDLAHVAKLLPASSESVVLCTSHHDAADLVLDGVRPIRLTALGPGHALDYLRRSGLRERIDAEPVAAAELVDRCGRLPHVLRLVAGMLRRRTSWSIARAVRELSDKRRRRDHLHEAFAALDLAVGQLPRAEAELYAWLGVFPGAVFSAGAVAALADLAEFDAESRLAELHRTCLVEENDQEQFLLHDLVGEHASEAARALGAARRDDALRRLVGWYRRQGAFADRMVMEPSRLRVVDDEVDGENPFGTREEALEWLERERVNILGMVRLAGESELHVDVIALCDGPLWALHNQHKHYSDTLQALASAIESAAAIEDPVAEARMRSLRGQLLMECGELDEAHEECAKAVAAAERAGHRRILASALEFQGKVLHARDEFAEAIGNFERARRLNEELGRRRGMALQEYLMGKSLSGLGRHDEALTVLGTALDRLAEFPEDTRTPGRIGVATARAHQALGQHEQAVSALREVIAATRERQASFDLAEPLELIADSLTATGQPGARECLAEALEIYEQAESPKAERVARKLGDG